MRFDPAVLAANPGRASLLDVLGAALDAVDPYGAVKAALHVQAGHLHAAGGWELGLDAVRRVFVVGGGKAGAPMARAVEELLGERIAAGLVVVKHGHAAASAPQKRRIEVREAAHPVPDAAGLEAGAAVLALVEQAGPDDLVIALLSGGGSALLEALPPGLALEDLVELTAALLACGADIREINTLRKHLSRVKGGRLAQAAAPAHLLTLVLSDVVGSPLDAIASGPTAPDSTSFADAWAVVEKYDLESALPPAVAGHLRSGLAGRLPDTPKPGDPAFAAAHMAIVADNRIAAEAACARAAALGWNPLLLTTFLEGEAAAAGRLAAALAKEVLASGQPAPRPACLVLGGETTVTLGAEPGRGGRNQELALAAALALEGVAGVTVAALATDGTDGPTDSAGALVDGSTVARGRALGLGAAAHLRRHDAYPYLQAVGDLLLSGPTQTNVNDLLCVFVE